MLQCHGMSLFCVWMLFMPMVGIRACWRECFWGNTTTNDDLHSLTFPSVIQITWCMSCEVWFHLFILTITVDFSPLCLHGDLLVLSVQVMPVYQSRVLTCILPGGFHVYVQACACSPNIWLCFNTVHELLFCGTWLAWLHFCIHLYTNTIYCIKKKMIEKKKMFIIWCWLLCKYNIFTIKVLYCYDLSLWPFLFCHIWPVALTPLGETKIYHPSCGKRRQLKKGVTSACIFDCVCVCLI